MYDWLPAFQRVFGCGPGDVEEFADVVVYRSADRSTYIQIPLASKAWVETLTASADNQQPHGAAPEVVRIQRDGDDEDLSGPVGG